MKTKYIYIFLLIFVSSNSIFGQQIFSDNQFLINKYSLSPSYAGITGHTEAFGSFKQNWLGVQGAPEYKSLNINGARDEKMGFGAQMYADKTGIFSQFSAKISYAYHLKIDKDMGVHFGLNGGIYNNRIDIASIQTSSLNDPVALSYQDYHGTVLDAGFGVLFTLQNLNIGFSMPRVLGSKLEYNKDYNLNYTLAKHYQAHISYFYSNDILSFESIVVVQKTDFTPIFYQIAGTFNYKKIVWASVSYKKTNVLGFALGAALSEKVVVNYMYEFGNQGIYQISKGSHELAIGFLIKHNAKKEHAPSIFSDSKDLLLDVQENSKIKRLEDEIKNLKRDIKKLQEDLKNCCENNGSSEEIKELKEKLELLEIELKDQTSMRESEVEYEKPFILENINFETNSDELKSSSFARLDELVTEMQRRPASTIKIVGYTDDLGGINYNLLLSKKRALSVKNYLIDKGIDTTRIVAIGLGKENPIATNSTAEGRALNRRIEVSFSANKK